MHVAWSALLGPREDGRALPLRGLRRNIEARLAHAPRFRRRLAFGLPGTGEPFWVDDEQFDIARHVVALCDPADRPDLRRFHALCDRALSQPLDRTRPLWRVYLAPKLADGGAGMVAKIHHALVDGKSAVEVALLLFDVTPDTDPGSGRRLAPGAGAGDGQARLGRALGRRRRVAARRPRGGEDRRRPAGGQRADLRHGAPRRPGGGRRSDAPGAGVLPQRADRPAAGASAPPRADVRRAGGEARGRSDAQRRVPGGGGRGAARDGAGSRRLPARPEGDGPGLPTDGGRADRPRQPDLARVRGPAGAT